MWADLHFPDENDITNYERLSQLEQSTGQPHVPDINIPMGVEHLWEWFIDLHGSRQSGFGVSPISYSEMKAWTELKNVHPTPWEISTLKRMDFKVINVLNSLSKQRSTKSKQLHKVM